MNSRTPELKPQDSPAAPSGVACSDLFGDGADLRNWVALMDAVTDKLIARGDILDDLERLQARNAIWEALVLINAKTPNEKDQP